MDIRYYCLLATKEDSKRVYYKEFSNESDYLEIGKNYIIHSDRISDNNVRVIKYEIESNSFHTTFFDLNWEIIDEIPYSSIKNGQVIDLSNFGARWEGDVYKEEPFGFGCIYNEHNEVTYVGYMFGKEKSLFGMSSELCPTQIDYCGTLWKGNKHGIGTFYSLKGETLYEGEVVMNEVSFCSFLEVPDESDDLSLIHCLVEELSIEDLCYPSLTSLTISHYNRLTSIEIGYSSFVNVKDVKISHLPNITSFRCRGMSFSCSSGSLSITHCPLMESISIASNSFTEFTSFHLEGMIC